MVEVSHGGLLRMLNVRMKVGAAALRVVDNTCVAPTSVRKSLSLEEAVPPLACQEGGQMIEGQGSKIGDPGWKIEDRGWRTGEEWRIVDQEWMIGVCGWSPAVSHLHGFETGRQPRMRKTQPLSMKPTKGRWCAAAEVKSPKSCLKKGILRRFVQGEGAALPSPPGAVVRWTLMVIPLTLWLD